MPDDNGTETTRSDAPSADDSLFGDAPDDAAVDEQDANEEVEQDPQGPDAAGEQDGQPEDLKVVVSLKGGRATIGVQQPSSDPHIESFDDRDLSGLAQEVLPVIERARARWEDEPKHPAHETRSPGQASDPAWADACAGWSRRGRGRPAATRDAAAVLGAGHWPVNPRTLSRKKRSRSARNARPQHTGGGHRITVSLPLHNHVCGPFCVSVPGAAAPHRSAVPYWVNLWPRPKSSARSRSAFM